MKGALAAAGAVLVLATMAGCSSGDGPDNAGPTPTSTTISTGGPPPEEPAGGGEAAGPCELVPLAIDVEVSPIVEPIGADLVAILAMAPSIGIDGIESATRRIGDALGPPGPENAGMGVSWDAVNSFVLVYASGDVAPTVLTDVVMAARAHPALRRIDGIDCPPGAAG